MKLAAVAGRGSKKDFIDIYFLLKEFSLSELLAFYNQKYSDGSSFMVLKSLTYFNDADDDPNPVMLIPTSWEQVKTYIAKEVGAFFSPS
jgi:glutamate synthase domain-containing protein 1